MLPRSLCWPRSATVAVATLVAGPEVGAQLVPADERGIAPIGQLRVEVLSCANLWNNDVGGQSDPYVVCTLGMTARTTDTIADDCNPAWSNPATFLFDVHESSQQCHLAVFDSESDNFNTFSDALLGIASFSVSSLIDAATAENASGGGDLAPVELTIPLDCSVYDGKLGAYHASINHDPSFVTVRAMLDLDDQEKRGAGQDKGDSTSLQRGGS